MRKYALFFIYFIAIFFPLYTCASGAPLQITTFSAFTGKRNGEVTLSWTYPGQTQLPSQSRYYIQNSASLPVAWSTAAAQAAISTGPVSVNSSELAVITGLTYGSTYYFRIWSSSGTPEILSDMSNTATAWAQVDVLPPARIMDLSAGWGAVNGEVNLNWTAPGDNGTAGAANYYKIRYSTSSCPENYFYNFEDGALSGWSTGGNSGWAIDGIITPAKGVYCAGSGPLANSQSSYIRRTVTGPFILSWWWKVDSEENFDFLQFYMDSEKKSEVSGSRDWNRQSFNIPAGDHVIEWRYSKDGSVSIGRDRGWIDEVSAVEGWWNSANTWTENLPAGGSSGFRETQTVEGLKSGTLYYFGIIASDSRLNWSDFSVLAGTTTRGDSTPPSAVNDLNAAPGPSDNQVTLGWTVTGDNNNTGALIEGSGFRIQYSGDPQQPWNSANAQIVISTSGLNPGQKSSTIINSLSGGLTYYFRVWTIDESGNVSPVSSAASNFAQPSAPPGKVQDLQAKTGKNWGEISLSWTSPGNDGYTGLLGQGSGINIQYSLNQSENWSRNSAQIIISTSGILPGTRVSAAVQGLSQSLTYYFALWTSDKNQNYSDVSNIPYAWAQVPQIDTIAPGKITSLTAKLGITEGAMELQWIAPGTDEYIGKANYYEIRYNQNRVESGFSDDFEYGRLEGWDSGGNANWAVNSSVVKSGKWAAKAGAIGNSQTTYIQKTVTGPFTLTFWWKVSSEFNDQLRFYLDSNRIYSISGEVDWEQKNYVIPAGTHVIKWLYYKDSFSSSGQDTGWIDGISTQELDTWWNSAVIWKNNRPAGGTAGTQEKETINGLLTNVTYFACIKTVDNSSNWSTYSNITNTSTQIDITPPAGISDLTGLPGTVEGQVRLLWTAPGDDGMAGTASGYRLKASQSDPITSVTWATAQDVTQDWSSFLPGGEGESRIISGLKYGATYYFAIKAFDDKNQYGVWYSSKESPSVNTACSAWVFHIPPSSLTDLAAYPGADGGAIILKWTAPGDDARTGDIKGGKYRIKYSTMAQDTWDNISNSLETSTDTTPGRIETASFTGLEHGVTCYFYVETADEGGDFSFSGPSNRASTWAQLDKIPPFAVTDLTAVKTGVEGQVQLSWTAPGDDGKTGNIAGGTYWIKYTSMSSQAWNDMAFQVEPWKTDIQSGNREAFTIDKLNPDTVYYFDLKTADEIPNWSSDSNKPNVAPLDLTPSVPSGLIAEGGDKMVTLRWNPNSEFDIASYQVYCDLPPTDGNFVLVGSTSVPVFIHSGLTNNSVYWYKISAADTPPIVRTSGLTAAVSANTSNTPPLAPQNFSGTAVSTTTIRWSWSDTSNETGYYLYDVNGTTLSFAIPSNTVTYDEKPPAVTANTKYTRKVKAFNTGGLSSFSNQADIYTLCNPPVGLVCAGKTENSISLSWSAGEGGAWSYQVEKSLDGTNFTTLANYSDSLVNPSYTDNGLAEYTTYWYRIRSYNFDSVASLPAPVFAVRTAGLFTEPVRNLSAIPVAGSIVQLDWKKSISANVKEYRVYFSSSSINYKSSQAILTPDKQSWTSPQLMDNVLYMFSIRGVNTSRSLEEESTNEIACEAMPTLFKNKTRIGIVRNGNRITGNKIAISADLLTGELSGMKNVLFQYRPFNGASWTDISAADEAAPFVSYWNTAALTEGKYQLRAVATGTGDVTDSLASYITVTVTAESPDIRENQDSDGELSKSQIIYNDMDNVITAGHNTSDVLTVLTIPSNALETAVTTVTVTVNPGNKPSYRSGLLPVEEYREITLENGQETLSNGIIATLSIPYLDSNNDGFVDTTHAKENDLSLYRFNPVTEDWDIEAGSILDTTAKTCTITSDRFSLFSIFAAVQTSLENAHAYPNPFKPNSGLGHTVIKFTGIPTGNTNIKVVSAAGDLVFEGNTGDTSFSWDGKNNGGQELASGIYVYYIKNEKSSKKGKLAIIR